MPREHKLLSVTCRDVPRRDNFDLEQISHKRPWQNRKAKGHSQHCEISHMNLKAATRLAHHLAPGLSNWFVEGLKNLAVVRTLHVLLFRCLTAGVFVPTYARRPKKMEVGLLPTTNWGGHRSQVAHMQCKAWSRKIQLATSVNLYIYIHTTAIVGFGLLSLSIGKGILLLGDVGMLNSWHVEHILEYYYLLPSGLGQNTSNQGFFCKALPTENMPRFFLLLHVETCLYLDMVPAMSI